MILFFVIYPAAEKYVISFVVWKHPGHICPK